MAKIDNFPIEELKQIVEQSNSQRNVLKALGYGGSGASYKTLQKRCEKYGINLEKFKNNYAAQTRTRVTINDLCKNSTRATGRIKDFIIRENLLEYKCGCCGNEGTWLDKPLTLQLDHINGINNDHRLENLRFLCPNCHTQTNTWGKNKYS